MRKFFEKFGLLMQIVISTVFIVFILMLMFGVLNQADFQNKVVYILFGTFIFLQAMFSIILLYLQYTSDLLSSVTVGTMQSATVKASITVIRRIIKTATKPIVGVKVGNAKVSIDEKGVALHLRVKLNNKLPEQAIAELRAAIISAFKIRLNLEFCFINFLISSVKFPKMDTDAVVETDTQISVKFADEDMDAEGVKIAESVTNPQQDEPEQIEVVAEAASEEAVAEQEAATETAAVADDITEEEAFEMFKSFDDEAADEKEAAVEAVVLGDEEDFTEEKEKNE